ncbi:hypothetical protein BY458DRAFT_573016 [Sporodiniella umbellata]|nr:hypothetical protein BY458DRAFT_573016 [Sporodiniella umbellata]
MNTRSKETLENVFWGTGVSGFLGATTGATMAVLKNAPIKQFSISTGLSCSVFGATFFCKTSTLLNWLIFTLFVKVVRETFISYQRQQNTQFGLKDSETRDIDALISSTMAGATTGGLLSAAFRK